MADSSSFSSLFALVDNHLSRTNVQDGSQPSTSGLGSFRLPSLNVQRGLSDTGLPSTSGLSSSSMRFPLPSLSLSDRPRNNVFSSQLGSFFNTNESESQEGEKKETPNICMSDCPINDVLAIQLSNMFKAREAKEQEERRKQQQKVEEMLSPESEASSCLIDLMPAVQLPGQAQQLHTDTLSSGSSMESIVMPDTADIVEDEVQVDLKLVTRPVSPLKPITTDMSYILKHKIGKCSEFGKVLCARYRPVAAPYFREYVPLTNVKVFDFSTPSPDDIVMERLRKPALYNANRAISVYD
ncbi:unnamed protein product [Arctia plantaginis]|uniref:Uncharacterized protein n=1 Tax=Arctia plantaginis TaxID=874455 RepID=A0A8S0Z3G2_ARCPL|nr:unnamed protein product [Arctia plantaginis]